MQHYYKQVKGWFSFADLYTEMVDRFPEGSHFVEVGSWYGKSAVYMGVEIINSGKRIRFDCIDSWENKDDKWNYEGAFDKFLINIKPVEDVVNYHKLPSAEASGLYDDGSLDFVFIDAAHDYENVKNDIELWYPKVKPGGVFAGHDYSGFHPGVVRAVNQFFADKVFVVKKKNRIWIHEKDG